MNYDDELFFCTMTENIVAKPVEVNFLLQSC